MLAHGFCGFDDPFVFFPGGGAHIPDQLPKNLIQHRCDGVNASDAVFLLYLKHPEGIRYKELSDYQQELEEIYSSITGREDLDSIRKSVSDLCDPLNNSINEKVSKVKKAFKDVVNEHTARFYYIDGKKGTAKRIALDRSHVLWG